MTPSLGSGWSGRLVVMSGPSGVGKSRLAAGLLADPRVRRAVTATSRKPRAGERDGVDYFFYDRERFAAEIARGAFLEHAEVHGNFYGTPVEPLRRLLEDGYCSLLVIDVQGATDLMNRGVPAEFVFIEPPSLEELARRLKLRGTDSAREIEVRLANAVEELKNRHRYRHRIVNDKLEDAIEALRRTLGL